VLHLSLTLLKRTRDHVKLTLVMVQSLLLCAPCGLTFLGVGYSLFSTIDQPGYHESVELPVSSSASTIVPHLSYLMSSLKVRRERRASSVNPLGTRVLRVRLIIHLSFRCSKFLRQFTRWLQCRDTWRVSQILISLLTRFTTGLLAVSQRDLHEP